MHRSGVQARVLARSRTCPVQVRGRGHPEQHTPRAERADSAAPPFIRFVLFLKMKTDQVSEGAPRKRAAPRLRPAVLEAPEAVAQAPRLGPGPPEGPACAGCSPGTDPHPQLPPLSVAAPRSSLASSLACQLKTSHASHAIPSCSSPGLSLSVCPLTFHSAEPPPAKTDPNPEADERAAAGREQGPGPRRGPALEVRRDLGDAGAVVPTPLSTSPPSALQAGAVRALGPEAPGSPAVGLPCGDLGRLVTRRRHQG